jgi:hypothetical protein
LDFSESDMFTREIATIGRKRFTEEQIVFALRQHDGGTVLTRSTSSSGSDSARGIR